MLTKRDIAQLKEIFVTKEEFHELKDSFFTKFDEVIGELRAIREDMAAMFYRQREHSDQLEHHEERLRKLEKPLVSPR